ncbi:hypothetical protein FOA52_004582 [Chlamydomonas sp. UWO 241]|nr:hypothetical protein FOA52_004582 [Chlamydomonas sp. UWO 241]
MRPLLLASALAALALASGVAAQAQPNLREAHMSALAAAQADPASAFVGWVAAHGKAYADDAVEFARRTAIWVENLEYAIQYNARTTTHWLGTNALADLTHEEYRSRLGYSHERRAPRDATSAKPFRYAGVEVPAAADWRAQGAVSPVKNQGMCGSCWAFSTTGSVEGINAITTGKLVSLSEQELVECDTTQDQGCGGGLMDNAFKFIISNGGLDTEDDYPYTAVDTETCNKRKLRRHVVSIDGFEDVPANSEAALRQAVAHQPVSVAIEADQKSFQLYMGGVFSDPECGTQLDHGVLAVGYGTDAVGGDYWLVKNSWGAQWGDSGYIKIMANFAEPTGLCGIAMVASYPTKNGPNPPDPGPEPGPTPGPTPGPKPGPPKPEPPVTCDDSAECPAGTTCCCVTELFSMCMQWGCCPMPKATCCEDHQHCCPLDTPVCDTASGRCLPSAGSEFGAVPWSKKLPATRTLRDPFHQVFKRAKDGKAREQQQ